MLQWANAMLVVSVEQLLGIDCDDAAQAYHLARVKVRGRVLLWRGWACTGSLHFIIPDATALYVLSADCLTSCCLPAHLAGLLAACLPACLPTWLPAYLPSASGCLESRAQPTLRRSDSLPLAGSLLA